MKNKNLENIREIGSMEKIGTIESLKKMWNWKYGKCEKDNRNKRGNIVREGQM